MFPITKTSAIISKTASTVLEKRYLAKDSDGNTIESPEDMFARVASYVAEAELHFGVSAESAAEKAQQFYDMISGMYFLPNSPTLMNAGRPLGQLSACFVLPVEDSIDKIFDSLKAMALIHKSGGGTGFSFSKLRPKDDSVLSTAGVSSGPVSFMNIFNTATETIKQGGTRRGANMAVLNVDHPDIVDFIKSKEDTSRLTNFNISVALTDAFMKAYESDTDYSLINPRTGLETAKANARGIFKLIVKMAWKNGEPGIIFIDRINEHNPLIGISAVESTNPCGEQPLLPFESCNLGSVNLSRFTEKTGQTHVLNYTKLEKCVRTAVRFLDDVIEINKYPLNEIMENTLANRKIGLGVMGFADVLIRLGIPYDSDESAAAAEKIMSFISRTADDESILLASERGVFPNYERSVYSSGELKFRNATRTTIAPTGTISMIAGTSSGIEPLFALAYTKNVMDGEKFVEISPVLEEILYENGLYSKTLIDRIAETGSVRDIDEIPDSVKKYLVTAHDISPEWHIKIQASFQKYTDNAVSKTVNFPSFASESDIETAYLLSYRLGCKGVTVYRDGSRENQVLTLKSDKHVYVHNNGYLEPKKRKDEISGTTRKINTGCGPLYVTINADDDGLFEVFAVMGKGGGCAASQTEAISRLISLGLRCGVDPMQIVKQIKGVRCPNQVWDKGGRIYSCADAIARAVEIYLGKEDSLPLPFEDVKITAETAGKGADSVMVGVCPECHGPLEFSGGCSVCRSCGFSRCG